MAIIDLPRTQAASGSAEQQLKAISDQIRVFRDQVERQLTDLESGAGTADTAASSAALSQIVSDISDIQNDIETMQSALPGKLEASDLSTIENSINAINTTLGNKLDTTGDGKDVTVSATAADTRANITTGDKLSVVIGKLMKWFTDLKSVAWSGSYNDLTDKPSPSSTGFLDAHPIGSIYITTNSDESTAAQMGTKYGGTWVAASEGRAIFGAGSNGETSIIAGDKLGSPYLQSHTHTGPSHTHTGPNHRHGPGAGSAFWVNSGEAKNIASGTSTNRITTGYTGYGGTGDTGAAGTGNTGAAGTGQSENIPPYEAFFIYKRTA